MPDRTLRARVRAMEKFVVDEALVLSGLMDAAKQFLCHRPPETLQSILSDMRHRGIVRKPGGRRLLSDFEETIIGTYVGAAAKMGTGMHTAEVQVTLQTALEGEKERVAAAIEAGDADNKTNTTAAGILPAAPKQERQFEHGATDAAEIQ